MSDCPKISIKKGREWHLLRGHPWLFSGAISQAPKVEPGSIVELVDCNGKFIATGYYNPACDIAVRVLSRKPGEAIDGSFLCKRIDFAWSLRQQVIERSKTNVFRLINAEGDFLPGFIVDFYAGVAVVQCHTAGADGLLSAFCQALDSVVAPEAIVVRNDASVRQREGLTIEAPKIAKGTLNGDLIVSENGYSFIADPIGGQKTGFFTDQRDKRAALAAYAAGLPAGAIFLNCFSYTCAFSVYAAGINPLIKTVNIEQSQPALDLGLKNFQLNGMPAEKHEFVNCDAFNFLEKKKADGTKYDIAVLDPPAFAKSHKDKAKALKAYGRMASLGLSVVKTGGIIALCSCSGSLTMEEFSDCLRQAAGESRRSVQIIETFQHGLDHPVNIMAPESSYLKVLFCRLNY